MSEKCEKCAGRMAFGRVCIEELEPDQEPFSAGVSEDIPPIGTHITVWGWICVDCGKPYDLWFRHEPGYEEGQDENLHSWRRKLGCQAHQLAQEKARAEKAEQGLCGASNDLILLRERTEKVEFDCESLHLELQAEKHNHQKDNEHLLARAEKAEEDLEAWSATGCERGDRKCLLTRVREAGEREATEKARREQVEVQLAGCATAALGWAKGENLPKKGDYGWSPAFDDVLKLRERAETAEAEVKRLREAFRAAVFCPKGTLPKGYEDLWDGAWGGG